MGKKSKFISKIICTALLSVILFSSECLADDISLHENMSGYRCLNSTCDGAYLYKRPALGGSCKSCGLITQVHYCKTCGREFDICPSGHIHYSW